MFNRIKDIVQIIIELDESIGFKKVVKYVLFGLFILGIFNIKTVTKTCIEFISDLSEEIHNEKMAKRDELLFELQPILRSFMNERGINADRILYFEYHNSKENLVGIPFKYVDLVLQVSSYGVPSVKESDFKDINVGMISTLYEDIKFGETVHYRGMNDSIFLNKYHGVYDIFEKDQSSEKLFISIPGITQPIGLIVLEWFSRGNEESEEGRINVCTVNDVADKYIPRINALIMSKN